MKSNYKPLGRYIQEVNNRDTDITVDLLLGVSIQKMFIPSIANTIGTDMSTYKIVKINQFAYGPVTSRNGDKISIALLEECDEAIVSQAYSPFEVKDTNKLDPEYLMMWFRRPEFDRYARFMSHGSAREIFGWDEMCNTLLPIPSIKKQREIVKEYNVIQNRIALNQQMIQKLEETAQALYKQWFVEYEFPNVDGKPYKSNFGEMVYNSEIEQNIPLGWEMNELQNIILLKNGKSKPVNSGIYPVYGGNGIIEYASKYNEENIIAIGRVGAYCGSLYRVLGKCWISDNAISAQSKIKSNMYSYYVLHYLNLNEKSEGTGQPLITQGLLNSIRILIPSHKIISNFEKVAAIIFKNQDNISQEIQKLEELKYLLFSKLAKV
jgi:type I restriction enzyme, S subunit